jgi:hypothetical protein
MSFGKFGAKPRAIKNPLYWVNMSRLDDRKRLSVERFNEKWHRLNDVHAHIIKYYFRPLAKDEILVDKDDIERLIAYSNIAAESRDWIKENINNVPFSELSKYSTILKKTSLLAIKICSRSGIYKNIKSFSYDSSSKSIIMDKSVLYYLG